MKTFSILSALIVYASASVLPAVLAALDLDQCLIDSTLPVCADYTYPVSLSTADLDNLCLADTGMPQMPGCSVRSILKDRISRGAEVSSPFFKDMSLLADICDVDHMGGMSGCSNYKNLCLKNGSVVQQCAQNPAIPAVLTTRLALQYNKAICGSHSMPGCELCDLTTPWTCDLMAMYVYLCKMMPGMSQCAAWKHLCSASEVSTWPELCMAPRAATPALSLSPVSASSCVDDSSQPECATYEYPSEQSAADLDNLCSAATGMPQMPGCTVRNILKARLSKSGDTSSPFFKDMSLLADICDADDMSGMDGCSNYKNLCLKDGSVVKQCLDNKAIPAMLTTKLTLSSNKAVCSSHAMPGCEDCDLSSPWTCDLMSMYVHLCKQMPEMKQCVAWKSLCSSSEVSSWPEVCIVPEASNNPPLMRMYFHTGYEDYVLFYGWVPRDGFQYYMSVLAVFLAAVFYEYLVTFRARLETRWAQQAALAELKSSDEEPLIQSPLQASSLIANPKPPQFSLHKDGIRGCLQVVESTLSYALMLVAMTFNVGLFVAVPLGFGFGTLMFGRFRGDMRRSCCA